MTLQHPDEFDQLPGSERMAGGNKSSRCSFCVFITTLIKWYQDAKAHCLITAFWPSLSSIMRLRYLVNSDV